MFSCSFPYIFSLLLSGSNRTDIHNESAGATESFRIIVRFRGHFRASIILIFMLYLFCTLQFERSDL